MRFIPSALKIEINSYLSGYLVRVGRCLCISAKTSLPYKLPHVQAVCKHSHTLIPTML